ncbi:hypothetical protein [Ornithinimicrobium sp. INDO-MA30-4]|uniref:hypothetical protein n=1 Tax=Ornithinimicrobium sp. INDO-MA30-4 TaxID=2908651 RepID=UPI001F2CBC22|nr:hypothetical protein [Ornithinimicrobium sp. INDO-MA30-4]UJH69668.1 hypothetical protein L0A91_10040 [Ornithinimicrobium sp. INDO-MA30-4]
MSSHKNATQPIVDSNNALLDSLPFDNTQDFEDADRGFVAALEPGVVRNADGQVVWDNDTYAFLDGDAPDTVNPSLWRQSSSLPGKASTKSLRAFIRSVGLTCRM